VVFDFAPEHGELRTAVRSLLENSSSEADVRRVMAAEEGYDPALWQRLTDELGLTGLLVPEELGGAGAGLVEVGIVLEEMGRTLYPGPFLSTVLATSAVLAAADAGAAADLLPDVAAGSTIATLAVAEEDGRWDGAEFTCSAKEIGGAWSLQGTKCYVADGVTADLLIVAAQTVDGPALFAVPADADGVTWTSVQTFDPTRRLATVTLTGAAGRLLGSASDGARTLARLLQVVRALVAVEQAGGAQAALDMAVAYAKDRVQFGRAIGSFQAIKHMCADALLDVESARSAAWYAVWAAAAGSPELPTVAPLAKAFCSETYAATAHLNMQVHGGISFTWEHPAHLYFRRAKSDAQLWGDPRANRELLATQLLGA
jgi:alkylation response protein AidB-like acyl-CoA dehydrogenase